MSQDQRIVSETISRFITTAYFLLTLSGANAVQLQLQYSDDVGFHCCPESLGSKVLCKCGVLVPLQLSSRLEDLGPVLEGHCQGNDRGCLLSAVYDDDVWSFLSVVSWYRLVAVQGSVRRFPCCRDQSLHDAVVCPGDGALVRQGLVVLSTPSASLVPAAIWTTFIQR